MLIVAFSQNGIRWTLPRILTLFMVVGDTPVFFLFLLYAAFSFVTLGDLEFMNVLTYGGRELGQYPFAVYGKAILNFCTAVVPYAWFQQIPLNCPTGGSKNPLRMFAPLICFLVLHRMIKNSSGAAVFLTKRKAYSIISYTSYTFITKEMP